MDTYTKSITGKSIDSILATGMEGSSNASDKKFSDKSNQSEDASVTADDSPPLTSEASEEAINTPGQISEETSPSLPLDSGGSGTPDVSGSGEGASPTSPQDSGVSGSSANSPKIMSVSGQESSPTSPKDSGGSGSHEDYPKIMSNSGTEALIPRNAPPSGHHSNTVVSEDDLEVDQEQDIDDVPFEESSDSVGLAMSSKDADKRRRVGSPINSPPQSLVVSAPEREASIASTLPLIPKKKKSALTVLRMGLLVGMSICLGVLLLLTLTRMRKRQLQMRMDVMASQMSPTFGFLPNIMGQTQHSFLGRMAPPFAIFTVTMAAYLFYQYEQEVMAAQRHRQFWWNFMKVGIISILVGLSLGYQYRIYKPHHARQHFLVSWRLFVYVLLGVSAMALAKLANRATRASA